MWNIFSYILYPVTYFFQSPQKKPSMTPNSFASLPENRTIQHRVRSRPRQFTHIYKPTMTPNSMTPFILRELRVS